MNKPKKPGTGTEQPPLDIKRYVRLILKRKYLIVSITAIVSILWLVLFFMFFNRLQYDSTGVVKFDDIRYSRGLGAVTDFAIMGATSKMAVLRTNSFLGRVVDSVKYNIVFEDPMIIPQKLIKKIKVEPTAKFGQYMVSLDDGDTLQFQYIDSEDVLENPVRMINIDRQNQNHEVVASGFRITFDYNELNNHKSVIFNHISQPQAIKNLNTKIVTQLDRSQTVMTVQCSDKNSEYSAYILNTTVNLFVQQLLDHKRLQASSVLGSLEQQMTVASREFEEAQSEYQIFRENNPMVTLASNRQSTVDQLATLQTQLGNQDDIRKSINELLSQKKQNSTFEEGSFYIQQIIGFLQTQNVAGATLLIDQYTQGNRERDILIQSNYPPQHPQVLQLESQLTDLGNEIESMIEQYRKQIDSRVTNTRRKINGNYRTLKNLPKNELLLADLDRTRQVKERVVSSIMTKIEEARVSDAAVIPDAYVIDEATPPLTDSNAMKRLVFPFLGPIFGIIFGIGFVLLMDFLDNTVKSAKDLEQKTNLKVLASIPVIINEKDVPNNIRATGELDPKLITSDYAPVLASEQFRFIRTKLSLESNSHNQCIVITSIAPGDGKSLVSSNIAITFAQQKIRTLLIDGDLRRGVLHKSFNCRKKPGIADLLTFNSEIDEDIVEDYIQKTHVPHLFLMSNGLQIPNPSELLGSQKMKMILDFLEADFDMIIIDTPPIEFIPDAMALNSFIKNILLVAREGVTSVNKINTKIEEFSSLKNEFRYAILNASKELDASTYNSYSYYNY